MNNVPIYLVDVLIHIHEGKSFIQNKIVKKILIKGYGRKHILDFRNDVLKKRTSKEIALPQGQSFIVKDISLCSQHGFGIRDF